MCGVSKVRQFLSRCGIALVVCAYIALGAFLFRIIEKKPCRSHRNSTIVYNAADNESTTTTTQSSPECENAELWSWPESILFCFVTITTIGYGNLSPSTRNGRIFCLLYALFGIPLAGLFIADIGNRLQALFLRFYVFLYRRQCSSKVRNSSAKITPSKCTKTQDYSNAVTTYKEKVPQKLPSWLIMILYFVYLGIGAALLPLWQGDWSSFDAFYFSFISLTTIGYGDLSPSSYLVFLTIAYLLFGLALAALLIGVLGDVLQAFNNIGQSERVENSQQCEVTLSNGKTLLLEDIIDILGKEFGAVEEKTRDILKDLDAVLTKHLAQDNNVPMKPWTSEET